MKKIIKKILREEIGDFDWVDDIEPYILPDKWIIHNDKGDGDRIKLETWLEEKGFSWGHGNTIKDMLPYKTIYYFNQTNNMFDGYQSWNNILDDKLGYGYKLYKWSDLEKYY